MRPPLVLRQHSRDAREGGGCAALRGQPLTTAPRPRPARARRSGRLLPVALQSTIAAAEWTGTCPRIPNPGWRLPPRPRDRAPPEELACRDYSRGLLTLSRPW